ncbi:hypothetical protein BJ508DRAFT_327688 [Ascobolus immersus RN42]|uniref:lytic cellulose monooxygenase (C4-dehydrogenating) n=1 Tax=Ascobolus immersus RN42 TaxID=1160509 RepID=A0A3N4I212_ASCIM|nr:hypothetical protein BJ508DRAFT_327688 [Ascobolus immersus RN42]
MKFTSILGLGALLAASPVLAHYKFTRLFANNGWQPDMKYIRPWTAAISDDGYVADINSADMRCHANARPVNEIITVQAGQTVGFGVAGSRGIVHEGVYTAYLARLPSGQALRSWNGDGNWFKIWAKGSTGVTSEKILFDMKSTEWKFDIPKRVPSGQYLLRFEHIALHSAGAPQFYISCAQLDIKNGGNGSPTGDRKTIKFPGGYKRGDQWLFGSIWWPFRNWETPGPKVWS